MGDRYILTMICPKCGRVDEVYFAPTCGFTTWECGCGGVIDLVEHMGITPEMASNAVEIKAVMESALQKEV